MQLMLVFEARNKTWHLRKIRDFGRIPNSVVSFAVDFNRSSLASHQHDETISKKCNLSI